MKTLIIISSLICLCSCRCSVWTDHDSVLTEIRKDSIKIESKTFGPKSVTVTVLKTPENP